MIIQELIKCRDLRGPEGPVGAGDADIAAHQPLHLLDLGGRCRQIRQAAADGGDAHFNSSGERCGDHIEPLGGLADRAGAGNGFQIDIKGVVEAARSDPSGA